MALFKDVGGQKVAVYAHDTANDEAKTGDAANITARISLDGGGVAQTNDVEPTELDATYHPGIYIFDMLQGETDCDLFILTALSGTADIQLDRVIIYTQVLDDYKANVANLDAAVSSRSVFDSTSDTVDIGNVAGGAVSGVADFKANVSNLDVAVSSRSTLTTANIKAITFDGVSWDNLNTYLLSYVKGVTDGDGDTQIIWMAQDGVTPLWTSIVNDDGDRSIS